MTFLRSISRSLWFRKTNVRKYRGILLVAILLVVFFSAFQVYPTAQPPNLLSTAGITSRVSAVKVAKATLLYGPTNTLYERAIKTHARHDALHGYELHILRRTLTDGFWNKFLWLQTLIVQELAKPAEERLEWIMYLDASILLLNPQVPLEIFLPSNEDILKHVNFVGSKPSNQLSSSAFFIRVSQSSLKLLTKVMAVPMIDLNRNLDVSIDQSALQVILNEQEFRSNAVYQPAWWYNGVETAAGVKPKAGDLLVHFPGNLEGKRWRWMSMWLEDLHKDPNWWEKQLQETNYLSDTESFWKRVSHAKRVLRGAEKKANDWEEEELPEPLTDGLARLQRVVDLQTWDGKAVEEATRMLEAILKDLHQ